MNVGELFVNLGVKGGDKTLGTMQKARKGLKDLTSVSFEVKAALAAALYAVQRLFSASGQSGQGLSAFNKLLSTDIELLQRYKYIAGTVGATNEQMESTFKSLAKTATSIQYDQEIPAGFAQIAQATGMTFEDVHKSQENPEIFFEKLNQYAQMKNVPVGERNRNLQSILNDDKILSAMISGRFNPKDMAAAPVNSKGQIEQQRRYQEGINKLSMNFQKKVGEFLGEHGDDIINGMTPLIDKIYKLAEAFSTLFKQAQGFKAIGMVFEGWGHIFTLLLDLLKAIQEMTGPATEAASALLGAGPGKAQNYTPEEIATKKKQAAEESPIMRAFRAMATQFLGAPPEVGGTKYEQFNAPAKPAGTPAPAVTDRPPPPGFKGAGVTPKLPALASNVSSNQVEVNLTQNFNSDGSNASQVGRITDRSIKGAFSSMSGLALGV